MFLSLAARRKFALAKKIVCCFMTLSFVMSLPGPAGAQMANLVPVQSAMTPGFMPPLLKGLNIHPENPFLFDFIVNPGDDKLQGAALKAESEKLVKFFLAAMTIPDKEAWVNLSPYEADRIIPEALGKTEMGKVMLEQDYLLKQMSSSLTNPDTDLGKKFWTEVKAKVQQELGTTNVPMSTFNKVWIVPAKAEVAEKDGKVYVTGSSLKVMLEEDFVALEKTLDAGRLTLGKSTSVQPPASRIVALSSQIFRTTILPELERKINQDKDFAPVRQIYDAAILAVWYKSALKESLLGKIYADKSKVKGVETDAIGFKDDVYNQYLAAFKKGAYNVIKEDFDMNQNELIPRRYFSGGMTPIPSKVTTVSSGISSSAVTGEDVKVAVQVVESTPEGATVTASGVSVDRITKLNGDKLRTAIEKGEVSVGTIVREIKFIVDGAVQVYNFDGHNSKIEAISQEFEPFVFGEATNEERNVREMLIGSKVIESVTSQEVRLKSDLDDSNIERIEAIAGKHSKEILSTLRQAQSNKTVRSISLTGISQEIPIENIVEITPVSSSAVTEMLADLRAEALKQIWLDNPSLWSANQTQEMPPNEEILISKKFGNQDVLSAVLDTTIYNLIQDKSIKLEESLRARARDLQTQENTLSFSDAYQKEMAALAQADSVFLSFAKSVLTDVERFKRTNAGDAVSAIRKALNNVLVKDRTITQFRMALGDQALGLTDEAVLRIVEIISRAAYSATPQKRIAVLRDLLLAVDSIVENRPNTPLVLAFQQAAASSSLSDEEITKQAEVKLRSDLGLLADATAEDVVAKFLQDGPKAEVNMFQDSATEDIYDDLVARLRADIVKNMSGLEGDAISQEMAEILAAAQRVLDEGLDSSSAVKAEKINDYEVKITPKNGSSVTVAIVGGRKVQFIFPSHIKANDYFVVILSGANDYRIMILNQQGQKVGTAGKVDEEMIAAVEIALKSIDRRNQEKLVQEILTQTPKYAFAKGQENATVVAERIVKHWKRESSSSALVEVDLAANYPLVYDLGKIIEREKGRLANRITPEFKDAIRPFITGQDNQLFENSLRDESFSQTAEGRRLLFVQSEMAASGSEFDEQSLTAAEILFSRNRDVIFAALQKYVIGLEQARIVGVRKGLSAFETLSQETGAVISEVGWNAVKPFLEGEDYGLLSEAVNVLRNDSDLMRRQVGVDLAAMLTEIYNGRLNRIEQEVKDFFFENRVEIYRTVAIAANSLIVQSFDDWLADYALRKGENLEALKTELNQEGSKRNVILRVHWARVQDDKITKRLEVLKIDNATNQVVLTAAQGIKNQTQVALAKARTDFADVYERSPVDNSIDQNGVLATLQIDVLAFEVRVEQLPVNEFSGVADIKSIQQRLNILLGQVTAENLTDEDDARVQEIGDLIGQGYVLLNGIENTLADVQVSSSENEGNISPEPTVLTPVAASSQVGGINFDPSLMNLQVKRDKNGVPLPVFQQDLPNINIEGLYPVIINIAPATMANFPLLSKAEEEKQRIPSAKEDSLPFDRQKVVGRAG